MKIKEDKIVKNTERKDKCVLSDDDLEFVSGGGEMAEGAFKTREERLFGTKNWVACRICPTCGNANSVERDGRLYCTACGGLM